MVLLILVADIAPIVIIEGCSHRLKFLLVGLESVGILIVGRSTGVVHHSGVALLRDGNRFCVRTLLFVGQLVELHLEFLLGELDPLELLLYVEPVELRRCFHSLRFFVSGLHIATTRYRIILQGNL